MVDLTTEAREYAGPHRGQEVILIGVTTKKLGQCQVRSRTEHPCPHQAVTEIWGIPFCEQCAREQEAYFVIGNLTMQPQQLASELEGLRRTVEASKR